MVVTEVVKEALWTKRFINNLKCGLNYDTVPIFVNNNSVIKLAHNPELHQRTKHIDVRHHFIRECVEGGEIAVNWISGTNNPADIFTKALGRTLFGKQRASMMSSFRGAE